MRTMKRVRQATVEQEARRWAVPVLVFAVGAILFLTLFPFTFDFGNPARLAWRSELQRGFQFGTRVEMIANVLLFVPFGFGLACWLRARAVPTRRRLVLTVLVGVVASIAIELLQTTMPTRTPSMVDVGTNVLGTGLGAWIFQYRGTLMLRLATSGLRALWSRLTPVVVGGAFGVWFVLSWFVAYHLATSPAYEGLGNWSDEHPMMIGNERTGDRSWSGTVSNVAIYDRSLPKDEVARVLEGADVRGDLRSGPVARVVAEGYHVFLDQRGDRYPFEWRDSAPAQPVSGVLELSPQHWLKTRDGAVVSLNRLLRAKGAFSIRLTAASHDRDQSGPARIFSISLTTGERNVTIGQEDDALMVRVRSPLSGENGVNPEVSIPGVFRDREPHDVVVTYDDESLRVYVDRPSDAYVLRFTPEMTFFWLISRSGGRINMAHPGTLLQEGVFYGLVFFPLGFCLAVLVGWMPRRRRTDVPAVLALVCVPLLWHLLGRAAGAEGWRPHVLVLSIGCMAVAYVASRRAMIRAGA